MIGSLGAGHLVSTRTCIRMWLPMRSSACSIRIAKSQTTRNASAGDHRRGRLACVCATHHASLVEMNEHLLLENASKGVRVLYTSTDGVGGKTPIAASGAVYMPKGSAREGGWPIIAWAHGTTGVADVCAPSWAPRSTRDTEYLNAWLAQGYAVVAADYQGLGTPGGHPWMSVRSEGWSVLDSVRAALGAFPELANAARPRRKFLLDVRSALEKRRLSGQGSRWHLEVPLSGGE